MGDPRISGPRPSLYAGDPRGGSIQFSALAGETVIKLPTAWKGEQVRIFWTPDADGNELEFVFTPDPAPESVPTISSTSSGGSEPDFARVDHGPDWLLEGHVDVVVPRFKADVLLLVKPAAQGRFKVRSAEV